MSSCGNRRIIYIPFDEGEVISLNLEMYEDKNERYYSGRNINSEVSEDNIILKNIYSLSDVRENISDLIYEFPTDETLVTQCALWIRAFSGFHFFYDANHRTGMTSLRWMMDENGIQPFRPFEDWSDLTLDALKASKEKRSWINRNNMYEEDELFEVWKEYFEYILD